VIHKYALVIKYSPAPLQNILVSVIKAVDYIKPGGFNPGVSNIRPAGQNRPLAMLNPALGMIL